MVSRILRSWILGACVLGVASFGCKKGEFPGVPKQAVALVKQGDDSLAAQRLESALDLYLKAVDMDGTFSYASAKAAEAYAMAGIRHKATNNTKMRDEMFKQSRTYVAQALESKPDEGYAFYVLGILAFEENQYDPAQEKLEKAQELGVSNFALHTTLGFLYNNRSETAKCIEQYVKASELRPDDVTILYNLGELFFAVGNYSKSTEYFGTLAKIQPEEASNRVNYAVAMWKDGEETKAKNLLNQVLESPTGNKFRNFNSVAWALIDKDVDYEWGLKLAHAADEMKPNNLESTDILGWGYFKAKNYAKAVEYLSKSMRLKPSEEVKRRLDLAREKLAEGSVGSR